MNSPPNVEIVAATPARWDDVVAVFGTRGDPSWCWCQYFVTTGGDHTRSAVANKSALAAQLAAGPPAPGLLAYAGERPVGWVQVGPRTSYPRVCRNRALAEVTPDDIEDAAVWEVTCFVVPVGHRRKGVSGALLAGAIGFAREHRARVLEGHPVDVACRGGRVGSADLYHGAASTFLAAGFSEVGRTGTSRPVVRLLL